MVWILISLVSSWFFILFQMPDHIPFFIPISFPHRWPGWHLLYWYWVWGCLCLSFWELQGTEIPQIEPSFSPYPWPAIHHNSLPEGTQLIFSPPIPTAWHTHYWCHRTRCVNSRGILVGQEWYSRGLLLLSRRGEVTSLPTLPTNQFPLHHDNRVFLPTYVQSVRNVAEGFSNINSKTHYLHVWYEQTFTRWSHCIK